MLLFNSHTFLPSPAGVTTTAASGGGGGGKASEAAGGGAAGASLEGALVEATRSLQYAWLHAVRKCTFVCGPHNFVSF
jgi:hypothetical protein